MPKSIHADLWNQTKPIKSETNGYWVLWPLVLLFLFQPSFHRPMAALPLVILAISRERNAHWAWRRGAFWMAFALFGLALVGDDLVPLEWLSDVDARRWFAANPYLFVLPGLGGCGIIAMLFASARKRGWISAGQLDRFRMHAGSARTDGLRPIRNASPSNNPAVKRPSPQLHEALALQMEKSACFKELSDQHLLLLQQGDLMAADQLKPECDQAKRDYDAAREDVQKIKAQLT